MSWVVIWVVSWVVSWRSRCSARGGSRGSGEWHHDDRAGFAASALGQARARTTLDRQVRATHANAEAAATTSLSLAARPAGRSLWAWSGCRKALADQAILFLAGSQRYPSISTHPPVVRARRNEGS